MAVGEGAAAFEHDLRRKPLESELFVFAEHLAQLGAAELFGDGIVHALFDAEGDLAAAGVQAGAFPAAGGELVLDEVFHVAAEGAVREHGAHLVGQLLPALFGGLLRLAAHKAQGGIQAEAEGEQRLIIGDDGIHQALELDLVGAAALIVGGDGKLGIQLGSAVVDLLPFLVAEYAQGVSFQKI